MGRSGGMTVDLMFGPYRAVAVLSTGPVATVYRAHDTSHGDRLVALKVFAPALSADAAFRERFQRDAAVLSTLGEPHVVPIHRYGDIGGALYVDMRLVRGPTLADVLGAGPLGPDRARAIAEQLAVATDALRRSGLGDRPLQRSEVLISGSPGRSEFVQLVGLALGRAPAHGSTPTTVADLVGPLDVRAAPPPTHILPTRPNAPDLPTPPRRGLGRPVAVAALLVTVALLATIVVVRGGVGVEQPMPRGSALVATISDVAGGVVDAEAADLDGRRVLVAATADGAIRTWDLTTGEVVFPPIAGDAVAVATRTVDGRVVVLARGRDTTVAMLDLATGDPVGTVTGAQERDSGPDDVPVHLRSALATLDLDGTPVGVAAQETGALVTDATGRSAPQIGLRSFSIPDGAPAGPVLSADGASIARFSVTQVEGRPVAVSLVADGTVQAHDVATGVPVGASTPPQPLDSLITAERDGAPVAVTGGADNAVRIWDLRTGEQIGPPLTGHTDSVTGLATVRLGTRTVLVSNAGTYPEPERAETRFWDLATAAPLGPPLVHHPAAGRLVTAAAGEPALLIATTPDGPVTVWDAHQLIQTEVT